MAFHFGVPGTEAGFLGVDLFFVLSGFLITRILLSQVGRGRVRLGDFWTRRARRLAPALVLGLAAMIAWGALAASVTLRDALRGDITATLAYIANWHFIDSAGYFSATGTESPLQHMWSLAVEEQFYVVWPLTLALVALLVRPPRARLLAVGILAASGVALSAWRLSTLWDAAGSDRAYMGTDSRMFGPLLGALLAVLLTRAPRLGSGRVLNGALIAAGIGGFVWAMLQLGAPGGASPLYPRGGAVAFAAASAALIWALAARPSIASFLLALGPIAYLGRLSYGMYIWHWPLVIWSQEGEWADISGMPLAGRAIVLAAATIAVASLSYHAFETPIRYGWLSAHLTPRRIAVALPAVLVSLIAVNVSFVVPHAGASAGGVTKTIVVVGDSVPQVLTPHLASAARKRGYVVISATRGGCPATGVVKVDSSGQVIGDNLCPRVAKRQDAIVKKYRPALVIWWSRYELGPRLGPDGKVLPLGSKAYWRAQRAAFEKRARALTSRGARLVAVQVERPGPRLAERNPSESDFLVGQTLLRRQDVVRTWNTFLASHDGPRVFSLSVDPFVCRDRRNPCDDRLPGGESARPDGIHYSDQAGPRVAAFLIGSALELAPLRPTRH